MDKSRILVADTAAVAEAVAVLMAGGIVAVPTETVYGLAARAGDAAAVARLRATMAPGGPRTVLVTSLQTGDTPPDVVDMLAVDAEARAIAAARVKDYIA